MWFHTVRESWKNINCWKNVPLLICSRHFKHRCYSSENKLKKSTFPTLFPTAPWSHLCRFVSEHNYASLCTQELKRRGGDFGCLNQNLFRINYLHRSILLKRVFVYMNNVKKSFMKEMNRDIIFLPPPPCCFALFTKS